MKAKDLLFIFIDEQVSFETGIEYITIDEYFDFEVFFGEKQTKEIPFGDYVYIWNDTITGKKREKIIENAEYTIDKGDGYYIYLVKIDD